MAEHTPGPWKLSVFYTTAVSWEGPWDRRTVTITHPAPTPGNPGREVLVGHLVTTPGGESEDVRRANAEFIVRACNAHDELLAALERLLEATGGCDFRDNANDEISGPCMGLADPMYGTECPECEARTVLAKAKEV